MFRQCVRLRWAYKRKQVSQRISQGKYRSDLQLLFFRGGCTQPETEKSSDIDLTNKVKLDINGESAKDLEDRLFGLSIDLAYAHKIVCGRPYKKPDELLTRKIIPEDVYSKIKDIIVVGASAKADDDASCKKEEQPPK